jgi:hypothetical protein
MAVPVVLHVYRRFPAAVSARHTVPLPDMRRDLQRKLSARRARNSTAAGRSQPRTTRRAPAARLGPLTLARRVRYRCLRRCRRDRGMFRLIGIDHNAVGQYEAAYIEPLEKPPAKLRALGAMQSHDRSFEVVDAQCVCRASHDASAIRRLKNGSRSLRPRRHPAR